MNVNLHGTRRLAEATVPAMVEAGAGRFVAIASAAALRAMPQLAAYSAAKAATVAFVRALAGDLAGTGVSANAVCPGSTRGVMLAASAEFYDLTGQEEFASQHLIRRLIEPSEIADAVGVAVRSGGVGADRRGAARRRRDLTAVATTACRERCRSRRGGACSPPADSDGAGTARCCSAVRRRG